MLATRNTPLCYVAAVIVYMLFTSTFRIGFIAHLVATPSVRAVLFESYHRARGVLVV